MSLTGLKDLTKELEDFSVGVSPQSSTTPWSRSLFDLPPIYSSPLSSSLSKDETGQDFPIELRNAYLQKITAELETETSKLSLLRIICHYLLLEIPDEEIPEVYEALNEICEFYNASVENDDRQILPGSLIEEEGQTMLSAYDVAKYFLLLVSEDEGDVISNLKLQKLLYYAQGFYLAIFNEPLFPEKIEAWVHGPVVPKVYHNYKKYGRRGIPYHYDIDLSKFSEDTKELLDEVYEVYGQFSASMLRNFTHEEPPWKDTSPGEEITLDLMKKYFVTQLV